MQVTSFAVAAAVAKFDGRERAPESRAGYVSYVARLVSDAVVLLTIYDKGVQDTIPAIVLREIAREMGHAK